MWSRVTERRLSQFFLNVHCPSCPPASAINNRLSSPRLALRCGTRYAETPPHSETTFYVLYCTLCTESSVSVPNLGIYQVQYECFWRTCFPSLHKLVYFRPRIAVRAARAFMGTQLSFLHCAEHNRVPPSSSSTFHWFKDRRLAGPSPP